MTNMSIQPLWLTDFIEILLVLEFQLKKFIVGVFSYKAHFRPQISSNDFWDLRNLVGPSILNDRDLKRFFIHGLNGFCCVKKHGVI